jgi:ribosomal protein S18 acetylase RimI-like enzyme
MPQVRRAEPEDADELMRLRVVMIAGIPGGTSPQPGPWLTTGAEVLRRQLADPAERVAAFVVDAGEGADTGVNASEGLASCVVGAIDERLPSPHSPAPWRGYVYNVATDPAYRRRGFSRACMRALLAWFEERGVSLVNLHASPDGAPLYTDLGFARTKDPSMQRISSAR